MVTVLGPHLGLLALQDIRDESPLGTRKFPNLVEWQTSIKIRAKLSFYCFHVFAHTQACYVLLRL